MSISVRSLGILVVMVLGLVGWLVAVSASGPRSASADVVSPFPPEPKSPQALEAAAQPLAEASDPAQGAGIQVEFGGGSDSVVSVLKSRLGSSTSPDLRAVSAIDSDVIFFVQDRPQWRADANGDGELNETDIAEFDELWSWADSRADFNADGIVDPDDYAAFVDSYNAGETKAPEIQLQSGQAIKFGATLQLDSREVQLRLIRTVEVTTTPAR